MKKSQLRQIIREEIQKAISEIKRVQVGPYTNAMGASSLKPGMNVSHIGVMDKLEHIGIIQWVEPKVTRSQFDNFTKYNVGYRKHEGGPVQTREFIQDDFFVENAMSEGIIANRDGAHLKADGKGKYWTRGKFDNSGLYTGKPDKRCQWCMENFHAFGGGRGGYGHTIDLHEFEITARPEKGFAMSRKYSDRGNNDALDYVA